MIINKNGVQARVYKTKKHRRIAIFPAMLMLVLLIAACGGKENNQGTATESAATAEQQAPSAAQQPASEPLPSEATEATKRTFTHGFGAIELSGPTERIVGVYLDDFLLALDVTPLTQTLYGQRPLPYLQDRVGHLPAIRPGEIDLELILDENPDLILLAYPFYAEEGRYELFSEIAPTYVFSGEDNWRQTLRTVGEVIGKQAEAAQWLDSYEKKVAEAREKIKAAIGDETVMLIRFTRAERIQLYGGPSNFSGDLLYRDLGLQPSALVKKLAWGDDSAPLISAELIPEFDADHIFIVYDNPANEDAELFKNSPLWQSVPAVKNGNLYEVEMFHWMNDGPLAYSRKVDDVLEALQLNP